MCRAAIVKADETNLKEWAELSVLLFPEHTFDEMYNECREWLNDKGEVGFLYKKDNRFVGFMDLSV